MFKKKESTSPDKAYVINWINTSLLPLRSDITRMTKRIYVHMEALKIYSSEDMLSVIRNNKHYLSLLVEEYTSVRQEIVSYIDSHQVEINHPPEAREAIVQEIEYLLGVHNKG